MPLKKKRKIGVIQKEKNIKYFCTIKKIIFFWYNIKMLEITIVNWFIKCNIERIIDPNNCEHFWINRRDLEIEIKRN